MFTGLVSQVPGSGGGVAVVASEQNNSSVDASGAVEAMTGLRDGSMILNMPHDWGDVEQLVRRRLACLPEEVGKSVQN